MSIPNYAQPSFEKGADNSSYHLQQQQLTTELQRILGDQRIEIPKVDATTVLLLNTAQNVSCILFNTTTGKFMGNEAGTFKTFTTS